ncbi:MAG: phosphoribosylamine--glycine ligase [Desulfobacterales bacterium]|nr:phosphoribosylamine--glycine ligase [Desulfobacterales bacterium]
MKILVVGGGGREHALIWKISQSPKVEKIYCAPGNAGISKLATCIPIGAEEIEKLISFAKEHSIDLTVVGPEGPLSKGIVDEFEKHNLKIFGPNQKAAEIEASKTFSKSLMKKYNIPTANWKSFKNFEMAKNYILEIGCPIVIKADGLAAGKGVIVCSNNDEAISALEKIMINNEFGEAGSSVIIEECLYGEEASFIAFTDGKTVLSLPSSQDHKQIYDEDKGPNTGGMGAYSPAPIIDYYINKKIINEVMLPTIKGMALEGRSYKGILYAGLMINKNNIKVLEFNARFGDPEAQPILMRIKNDIIPIMEAVIDERLDECKIEIDDRPSVCVVMASQGYPGNYKRGSIINGLDKAEEIKDASIFHAGTSNSENDIVTSGGRVLGVTAIGTSIKDAINNAYSAVSEITWDNAYYRKDIGKKAIKRLEIPPKVAIVMGSDSDINIMLQTVEILKEFDIPFEMTIASAHRTPRRAEEFASSAKKRGVKVIIAGAGHAAHLAGVMAAWTTVPIIGVPIDSSCLNGLDSLLSTVQMPPGVPVATMAIGKSGAKNAGLLAIQILALSDPVLDKALENYKQKMLDQVEKKAKNIEHP